MGVDYCRALNINFNLNAHSAFLVDRMALLV